MMTAASALRWEIRRALRLRVWLTFWGLLIVAGSTLLPMFGQQYRGYHELGPEQWRTSPVVHLSVTVINLGICLFGIGQGVGMSTRQYSLPITSQQLAAVRLLPGATWCALLYLTLCTLFNTLFAARWPYLGPALTYGVSYMVVYSTVYRFRGNENRTGLAVALTMIGIIVWIHGHYPRREPDNWLLPWIEFSLTELVVLTSIGVLSWLNLVDAIERDRRGAGWGQVIRRDVVEPTSKAVRRARRPFWSAVSATFWFEWKLDGWLVPFVVIAVNLIVASINIGLLMFSENYRRFNTRHEAEFMSFGIAFVPLCIASPWFAGLVTSHGKRAISQRTWPSGQSTLPLSDAALGWVMQVRCLASTLVSILGVAAVTVFWYGMVELVLRTQGGGEYFADFPWNRWRWADVLTYIAVMTFAAWMVASIGTVTALSGRRWIAAIPLAVVPVLIILSITGDAIADHYQYEFWMSLMWLTLGCLFVGMVLAYSFTAERGLIGWRSWLAGIVLLVLAEGIGLSMWFSARAADIARGAPPWHVSFFLMYAIMLSLAAAAPAILPLATYANRHR